MMTTEARLADSLAGWCLGFRWRGRQRVDGRQRAQQGEQRALAQFETRADAAAMQLPVVGYLVHGLSRCVVALVARGTPWAA